MVITPRRPTARSARSALSAAVAVLVLTTCATPALAIRTPGVEGRADGGDVVTDGNRSGPGGGTSATPPSRGAGGGGGARAGGPVTPRPVVRFVVACPANTVEVPTADELCAGAIAACDPPRLLYWRYAGPAVGALERNGTRCLTAAEAAAGGGEEFPGFTVDDLRRLPLPPGVVVLEPGNGYALAGVPLNAVADAAGLVLPGDVAGFAVQVRATPVSYTWDFGDGTVLGPTADPGTPWQGGADGGGGAITHTYLAGGGVAVVLMTTYAGEFSVDGGAFQPVVGTAQVASVPVPLEVLEGRGALVGDVVG